MSNGTMEKTILVVDDTALYRSYAGNILEQSGFAVYLADSGEQALELLQTLTPGVILLDIIMTGIDGYETFKRIRSNPKHADTPIIFLTAETDTANELTGFKLGAADFIYKPFVPEVMIHRIERVLKTQQKNIELERELKEKSRDLQELTLQTISALASTVDAKSGFSPEHSRRVGYISREIGRLLGYSEERQTEIYVLGLLHDIGKICIPDAIMNKPTKLSEEEYEIVKKHTITGYEILKSVTAIPNAARVARSHHERFDGNGYPDGLSGKNIPLDVRIIAIADAYDAMTSTRPYRDELSTEDVVEELRFASGGQFDPSLVELVIAMIEDGSMEQLDRIDEEENCNDPVRAGKKMLSEIYANSEEGGKFAPNHRIAVSRLENISTRIQSYIEERNGGSLCLDKLSSEEIAYTIVVDMKAAGAKSLTAILLTLASEKDVTKEEYEEGMEHLRDAVKLSLRHGDFDMKYDPQTYLLMIGNVSDQISDNIVARIGSYFASLTGSIETKVVHVMKKL